MHRDVQHMETKPLGGTAGAEPDAPPMSSVSVLRWIDSNTRDAARACHRKLAATSAAGPLIFVFVCLAVSFGRRRKVNKTKKSAQTKTSSVPSRSLSMAALHGGKAVLARLIDAQEVHLNQKALEEFTADMKRLLSQHPVNFAQLSKTAAKLEMSGNEDEAIKLLQEAIQNAEKDRKPHEVYELQMLVVEMLIYKGQYKKALNCKCMQDEDISDARIPLYKAIIYTIIGNKEKGKECYQQFREVRNHLHTPKTDDECSQLFHVMHEHDEFEKLVENIKREIELVHKSR